MRNFSSVILLSVSLLAATTALAQSDGGLNDRLSRIERDVNFLQRQVYRSTSPGDTSAPDVTAAPVGAAGASLEVRLSQISDEVRALRGQIEQAQFQSRQNAEDLRKLTADVDYRLQALEQRQAAAAAIVPTAPLATPPVVQGNGFAADAAGAAPEAVDAAGNPLKAAPTGKDFTDANAHYTASFKLLNEKNYAAAATSFDAFVKKYPNDPLVGNAYYWLGESYYARGDYTRAADGFRKGFESNPEGEKAADNLLKLALSLVQVKRVPEACIVLKQIGDKYEQSNARTASKAVAERTKLQCK